MSTGLSPNALDPNVLAYKELLDMFLIYRHPTLTPNPIQTGRGLYRSGPKEPRKTGGLQRASLARV